MAESSRATLNDIRVPDRSGNGVRESEVTPWSVADKALDVMGRIAPREGGDGRGPSAAPAAIAAAVLASALLWGAHEVLGGKAAAERYERLSDRVERLEDTQTDIRIQLAAIARAVGADEHKR